MEATTITNYFLVREEALEEIRSFFESLNHEVLNTDDEALLMPSDIEMDGNRYAMEFELTFRKKIRLEDSEQALMQEEDEEDLEDKEFDDEDDEMERDELDSDDSSTTDPYHTHGYLDYWIGVMLWLPQGSSVPQISLYVTLDSESAPYVACWKDLKQLKVHLKGRFVNEKCDLWDFDRVEIFREALTDVSSKSLAAEILKQAEEITEYDHWDL